MYALYIIQYLHIYHNDMYINNINLKAVIINVYLLYVSNQGVNSDFQASHS